MRECMVADLFESSMGGVGMPENMTGAPALVTAAHFATATSSDSALVKAMRAVHAHISPVVKTEGGRKITAHEPCGSPTFAQRAPTSHGIWRRQGALV